jgi:FtsP/CotA-like multicopper oxidase with cupredoxin domain
MDQHVQPGAPAESFPTEPSGLTEATRPALLELADGEDLRLRIDPVAKRLEDTTDILFDVTEPGLWMAHCHIAEHMQSGMMFSFTVARREVAR